jgi:glycosyltransferase involved in cell wall biosynthesis
MRDALVARGVPAAKVEVVHNWADAEPPPRGGAAPEESRFRLVYGGNLGRAQALGSVVDAAGLVARRRPEVEILLYGDGVEADWLRRRAELSSSGNLRFPGSLPQTEIVDVFASADALLLHLGDDPLFAITIPSKTQFYLAMGRPIVAGVAGEAADILRRSGAALVVPPGDPAALADAICRMAELPRAARDEMAGKGRACYEREFAFGRGVARTLAVIEGTHPKRD